MNGKNGKKLLWVLTLFVLAGTPALAAGKNDGLSAATHKELARARSATARYHDVAQAEADGYSDSNLYVPGEGFHWLKSSLLDANFDPEQPEVLLYAPVPGENRLQLVAVEYLVPLGSTNHARRLHWRRRRMEGERRTIRPVGVDCVDLGAQPERYFHIQEPARAIEFSESVTGR